MSQQAPCQLILALDLETREETLAMLDRLDDPIKWVKIGLRYSPHTAQTLSARFPTAGIRSFST